ncbi:MAG: acyl-CoA thioesterase [Granulosicoccaceae bacterium]
MSEQAAHSRADYPHIRPIQTRWMDNDVYGHVNNVNYYSYFDTAVNGFLIEQGVLDIHAGEVIGLVVETQCSYLRSLAFPEPVEAGLRVGKLGNSSVRYEIALFKAAEDTPAARGYFVHVYVDRESRRPTSLPVSLRAVLEQLVIKA